MLAHQLDLFGGPPKPPKKIKSDVPSSAATKSKSAANQGISVILPSNIQENDMPVMTIGATLQVDNPIAIHPLQQNDSPSLANVVNTEPQLETLSNQEKFLEDTIEETAILNDKLAEFNIIEVINEDLNVAKEATIDAPLLAAQDAVKAGELSGEPNIPPDTALFQRQYYSMRETAAMFQVNQSLLRFWENEFDVLTPKKNKKGDRYFRPSDIKNLALIYHLLKVKKFTIEGAREYLKSNTKALDAFDLVQRLEKLKSFLFEMKANL